LDIVGKSVKRASSFRDDDGIKHPRRRRYFCDHVVPPSGGAFDESNVLGRRVFDGLVREKNVSSTLSS